MIPVPALGGRVRRFLLVAHTARTDSDFRLDDLPGSGGRMDLVARCAIASLLVSHGVRRDAEFLAVLLGPPKPPRFVRIVGAEVRGLNPDERSTGALLRKALAQEGLAERSTHSGVYAAREALDDVLASLMSIVLLDEHGEDIRNVPLDRDATFVLSDHLDFTEAERAAIRTRATRSVSVGSLPLQADQVITLVHNELDRRG